MISGKSKHIKISFVALMSFFISIIFCTFLITTAIVNKINVNNLRIEQQIYERTHRLYEIVSRMFYKTQTLEAIVLQGNGNIDAFDLIAPTIVDDPAIQNVLLAPDGIVTKIFPFSGGNENLIGWNYFDEELVGNHEAIAAIEMGQLVLSGPIDIIQGGSAIAGRLPVYIDTLEEEQKFWGLVSVTLKLRDILDKAELEIFNAFGYTYELWRINPDTNTRQTIAGHHAVYRRNYGYIERSFQIYNAEWFLRVSPIYPWYYYPDNIALIIAGFCMSLIVLFVMQNNFDLKKMQSIFERMAITDPLTGIFNRRHFMEIVRISVEKARRHHEKCYFIMFDIDRFKNVNDTYGHQIGDKILMDVTARVKADIRPYDLFARYGGEEFIIFTHNIDKKSVCEMTERLRLSLCTRKYEYANNIIISSSASFGIACLEDYNIDKGIKRSDEALYTAKRNGRNCVVYWEEDLQNNA